ncbi:glycosyl hydrolase family 28-related protein [Coraliomargarita sp. SDUM461003]|uniref:Glycosyl hydrolase family 28-related protein n=1 Tax=Thalassobacterium maritimum TaxID=3041265 RepID=A0ABU1AWR1_9BACT|nr:glycosyl hydrolase family 28-related protein [Coraliomargarita sp. SDUM461003]MDQ8208591.1 glycosyl hydrolase family 28-related protein [Coraliomargarita sp. SDUM461003]
MTLDKSSLSKSHSELWGDRGNLWSPHSRLPDFSCAGYRMGERPLPELAAHCCVTDFGAVGDGQTDCTEAFKSAIAASEGVIQIPAGRYLISDILWIKKSGVVLRGAGIDQTIIQPTTKLELVRPFSSATTEGLVTSEYSWSGGFLWILGERKDRTLSEICSSALRGDQSFEVKDASQLTVGQIITVSQKDTNDGSLLNHLYADDPGEGKSDLKTINEATLVTRIKAIDGNTVKIERPLTFDLRESWQSTVNSFEPTVTESGIEHLSIEFPVEAYPGHFKELGLNAISIEAASHCWIRNVDIRNSDSGIFLKSNFCTVEHVSLHSQRPDVEGDSGHHGISFTTNAQDNLLQHFEFNSQFIHDITVENMACGNVIKYGRGPDLSLDHHRFCPYNNLFSQIDCGRGKFIWRFGGGLLRGKHTARGASFWGIRSLKPIEHPGPEFGPSEVNFVALDSKEPESLQADGLWWEPIPTEFLQPQDLHAAQLQRRLQGN